MLDLRRLRYFVTVADELHFGRAAERLHIAQPPLTRHIASLESELGMRLFERSTRAVTLTPEGAQFLEHARQVIDAADHAEASAQRLAQGTAGRLAIGYTSSIPMSPAFSALVRGFSGEAPEVALTFREVAGTAQPGQIAAGVLDIAFGWAAPDHADDVDNADDTDNAIAQWTVAREPLVAAVPASSEHAARAAIAFESIAHECFIAWPTGQGSALNTALHRLCAQAGVEPRLGPRASQVAALVALVAAGQGVAIVPAFAASLRMADVAYVPLIDAPVLEQTITWRTQDPSRCALRFAAFARAATGVSPDIRIGNIIS
ncbi:LysR substrate-binding domain-containing protein [Paraburkholderia sp.]|uniref:LysR substrate-binding domain-containing protein n=1 Tax=Paraburkholderia sp. TaxID=1926495 RepID=UPI00286F9621|nr:LysR substrate-binding domain-containing protein [Paraburkholderia sp.]